MRCLIKEYGLDISFGEKKVATLLLESAESFLEFLTKVYRQAAGDGEYILLSENDKEINFEKNTCIISDPLHIDVNNRKILSKLYQDLEVQTKDFCLEKIQNLNLYMEQLMLEICENSEYALTYTANSELVNLFKIFDLRIENTGEDLPSRLIDFIKLNHRILKVRFFILVNIRDYLSDQIAEELFRTLAYEDVCVLCVERHDSGKLDLEQRYIVDKDNCVIYD